MLRKTCCFILLLFVFLLSANGYSYNYTNDGGKGKSISFTEPVVEKNGKIIKSSFSGIFRNNLEGVWIANSAIEVVASDKVNEIIEIQKKSQDSRHSDKTVIEAGSLIAELFSADTKIIISASESFTATIRIRDNKTKKIIVNWTTPVYINEEEFTSYAANDIALYALPLLGVNLSSLAKTNLSYRKNRPNESLFDAQSHFNNLTASIAEIDKQLSQIEKNKMEDNNAVAEKARLTAELEQLRIQQKEADVRVKRLQDDEKRIAADKQRAKNRSEELNKKIAENGLKYDKLADIKRKKISSKLTADAKIRILEKKKQGLLALKDGTVSKTKDYFLQENADCEKKVNQIENMPYSAIEKDERGKITKAAKKERQEKIKIARKESEDRKQKYLEDQYASVASSYEIIRQEVSKDILDLQEQTEYSLLNSNLLRFGNYDGAKESWVAYVKLILAGEEVSSEKIFIPYKNITGLSGGYTTEVEKNDYNSKVEEYNSYFANNIPVIYVEINYDIMPASIKNPSQYKIKINSYTFKKIENDEVIYKLKARSSTKTLSITPAINIDYTAELTKQKIGKEVDAYIQQIKKEEQKREKQRQKISGNTANSNIDFFGKGYLPLGLEIGVQKSKNIDINFGINSAYLFYQKYFDVGPELKISFSKEQFNFKIGAKIQKKLYYDLYFAGDIGLDFFNVKPSIGAFIGAEVGYQFLENWSISLKFDINTQPTFLFLLGVNYYFR